MIYNQSQLIARQLQSITNQFTMIYNQSQLIARQLQSITNQLQDN
jgi:hypothetical protein